MEIIKLIGVKEVQQMLGVGKAKAVEFLSMKDCPTLPRKKNEPYRVREEAFVEWFKNKF